MHRETIVGELECRLEHLGQRPGAEIAERSHERIEGRGHAGGKQSRAGDKLDTQGAKMANRRARGRHHIAVDGDDAAGRC